MAVSRNVEKHDNVRVLSATVRDVKLELDRLILYYQSPKFKAVDSAYVSTDVLPRLTQLRNIIREE